MMNLKASALLLALAGLPALAASPFAVMAAHAHEHHGGHEAAPAVGSPVQAGELEITGAFTRATLPNAPVAGGYLTITSHGAADRLVGAQSPAAETVELHEMKMSGDMMQMSPLPDGIPVPAGGAVSLAPGGLHIMFIGLKQTFVEGEAVPVTLTFEKAGTVEVQLVVGPVGASAAPEAHQHHSSHMGQVDQTGLGDEEAIANLQKGMFDTPDNPLAMGPIVVVSDYAISDWAQGGTGGRALLRKTAKGWAIHLCAGDGLRDAANLVNIGVPHDIAMQLAEKLATAEAGLAPEVLAQYAAFDGVMMVDETLI